MTQFTKDDLKTLSGSDYGMSVSLYLPTHEAGAATRENAIRFKNRVQEAGAQLRGRGYDDRDVDRLLGPAQALVQDNAFWQHQRKGLALFLGAEAQFRYQLPIAPEELSVVSDRFHLKPLLPLLTGDGHFYILAVTLNSVRLLEATRYGVREVPLGDAPTSMAEALRYDDDPEPTLRAYATGSGGGNSGGSSGTLLQAQGAEEEDRKEGILRFFKKLDNGVRGLLEPQGDRIPLVFAGNVANFPIYQEANHYHGLLGKFVEGNPETLSDEALHERAWKLVAPHFGERREKDAEAFRVKQGSDPAHAGTDLQDVLPAAYDSRVQTLFVPLHEHRWGRYDPDARLVNFHDDMQPDSYDLFDLAAVQTLLSGGSVYTTEQDGVPGGGVVAAVYRF